MNMFGKVQYNFHLKVAEVVLNHGIIFGGYVRDTIIHNHHAERFYERFAHEENFQKLYNDPEFDKQTVDRLLIPSDIDCYMSTTSLNNMVEKLKCHSTFKVKKRKDITHSMHLYITGSNIPSGLILTKLEIGMSHNPLYHEHIPLEILTMKVKIDVLHAGDISNKEPPFGNMDFECNCLIMDQKYNIRLSSPYSKFNYIANLPVSKHRKLHEAIENTIQRKAIPVVMADYQRCLKMVKKGWCIEEEGYKLSKIDDTDDICPICLDTATIQLKYECCNSRYHPECFAKIIMQSGDDPRCPTCRKPFHIRGMRTNLLPP